VRDPSYDEAEVSAAMKNPKIQIKIALGLGKDCRRRAYHQGNMSRSTGDYWS